MKSLFTLVFVKSVSKTYSRISESVCSIVHQYTAQLRSLWMERSPRSTYNKPSFRCWRSACWRISFAAWRAGIQAVQSISLIHELLFGKIHQAPVKTSKQSQSAKCVFLFFSFNLPEASKVQDKTRILHPTFTMFVVCSSLRVNKSSKADYKVATGGSDEEIYRGGVEQTGWNDTITDMGGRTGYLLRDLSRRTQNYIYFKTNFKIEVTITFLWSLKKLFETSSKIQQKGKTFPTKVLKELIEGGNLILDQILTLLWTSNIRMLIKRLFLIWLYVLTQSNE